jgi:hypothetical protein
MNVFTIFYVKTRNRNSVRSYGNNGDPTSQSLDINHNSMRRDIPIMVVSRYESASAFQEEKFSSPKSISSREASCPGRQDSYDGSGYGRSPNHNKYNDCNKKITKEETSETENGDSKIYLRGVDPYRKDRQSKKKENREGYTRNQRGSSKLESENVPSIELVSEEYCPNKERMSKLQSSLGELCRVGTLDGRQKFRQRPVHLYTRTIRILNCMIMPPCLKCQFVAKLMNCMGANIRKIR